MKHLTTKNKLFIGFGLIISLTLAIVFASFWCLSEIEQNNNSYKIVITAQKDFLQANSYMETYLNEHDSIQFSLCTHKLDSAIYLFDILKSRLNFLDLILINHLYDKLYIYKKLMKQIEETIDKQNEIAGDRRKMRVIFINELKKSHISRNHIISYYFNQARLNAVYLLSSTDITFFNESKRYVDSALIEAYRIRNFNLIKSLNDYMVSVKDNYELSLKIKDIKESQIILGNEILSKSGNLIANIESSQEKVRKSTKVFLLIFSIISIVISIIISQLIIKYMTSRHEMIKQRNKILMEHAETMDSINTVLEERQQHIEEQAEELMTQRDQLSQLNATKDKLFSILAHDLRSPFNATLGFSDLLLENIHIYPIEKIEKQVTYIRDSIKYTYDLLDNLLQWSRAQRGVIGFEPEIMNVSAHVYKELQNLRQQAMRKDIDIKVNLIGKEKFIEADPNLFDTVVRNLTSNAIKFSHKKSTITITLQFENDEFVFSVQDLGLGMTTEIKNLLFNGLENKCYPGTAGEKGTGLGLLLCADFVSLHHGRIWVESEKDEGSTFHFSIPYTNGVLENL